MKTLPPGVAPDSPPGTATARTYHHGDLRNALVEAGLKLIESRPADDMGLRELARQVGVSPTAIYRHFPDKLALKTALAKAGLDRLAQVQVQASAQAGGGAAGFHASGMAYVRFAADNPALFRLVFTHAQPPDLLDAEADAVPAPIRGLRAQIGQLMPADWTLPQRKAVALHAWALVHGLAMLVLDQQIPVDWSMIDEVLRGYGAMLQLAR